MDHDADTSRARRGAIAAVALLALAAGAVACGGSGGKATAPEAGPPTVSSASSPASSPEAAAPEPSATADDLRPLLLALPKGARTSGAAAGEALALADLTDEEQAELRSYGFTSGARRAHLTADGKTEVSVTLRRLADASAAARHYATHDYGGTPTVITTLGHPAKTFDLRSGSAESTDATIGVSYRGDVQFTISATGAGDDARTLVTSLLGEQYRLLP